jgi:site-specific recombinase XerD
VDLPWLDEIVRAKRPQRLPAVLTPEEVRRLLESGQDIRTVQELLGQGFPTPLITSVRRRRW